MKQKQTWYNNALLFFIILIISQGCHQKQVSGQYKGTCENQTYGIKSTISLTIHQNKSNISGFIKLSKELYGSGNIKGKVKSSTITFTTKGDWGEIIWTGKIKGKVIEGKYIFDDGFRSQEGTWIVEK